MNVLMISGDPNLLKEGTEAYARLQLQKAAIERLDVVVWPQVHTLKDVHRIARTHPYEVITAQDPFWRGRIARQLAKKYKAKLNLQVHTDLSAQPLWRRWWAYSQLRHADSVRVVSEHIKNQVAPYVHGKISVLPVFVELSGLRGLTHLRHPSFPKTILWIGRFEEEKDPFRALSILSEVRALGTDAGLVMLGAGNLEGKLRHAAKGFSQYVEFPGWGSPADYLKMADVVVSTSVHESYGASIIESLAAGVPVVAPDVGIAKAAGAIIVERSSYAAAVNDVLQKGTRAELLLTLPDQNEWARLWRESLV